MKLEAKAQVEMFKDKVEVVIDFVGHTELEHEFIKELFAKDKVEFGPENELRPFATVIGEHDVRVRMPITRPGALERAKRVIENRRRISAGQPTLEQEEAAKEGNSQVQ